MKTWFKFQAKADGAVEVSIFDEIGMWGVTAKNFIAELKAHAGKAITVSINSPGGSVFDALAIYNALRAHGSEITVKVMGVAASAASLIAMAGDKIIMPENTFMMVHNPLVGTYGNADELRDMADVLDKIGASLIATYVARTGLSEDEVKALLDAESWLNAEDAVAKGFATEMEAALKIAATYDVERFPENVRALFVANSGEPGDEDQTSQDETTDDSQDPPEGAPEALADMIHAAATAMGLGDYSATVALRADVKTIEDAKAILVVAHEVSALCTVAGKPDMAGQLIRDGVTLDSARARITNTLADEADKLKTSNVQSSAGDKSNAPAGGVWAKIFPKTAAQHKE